MSQERKAESTKRSAEPKIALFRGVSLQSRIIRWFTRGPYSHAALVMPTGTVIEAWRHGVRKVPSLSHDHTPGTVVDLFHFRRPLSSDEELRLWTSATLMLGRPYDLRGMLRFFSRRRTVGQDGAWFCSELVAWACRNIGRPLLNAHEWLIAPTHLAWSTELERCGTVVTGRDGEADSEEARGKSGEAGAKSAAALPWLIVAALIGSALALAFLPDLVKWLAK